MSQTKHVEFDDGSTATVLRDDDGITIIDRECNDGPQTREEYVTQKLSHRHDFRGVYSDIITFDIRIIQDSFGGAGEMVGLIRDDPNLTLQFVTPLIYATEVNREKYPNVHDCAPTFCVDVDESVLE